MDDPTFLHTEIFDLPRAEGRNALRISLSRPPGLMADAADIPVVYVLDADIGYASTAAIAHYRAIASGLPDPIVVGVGYGAGFLEMAKLRTADLTPPLSEGGLQALGGMTALIGEASGGADAFLSFIIDILAPEIARRAPQASVTRQVLFGHSLGGLFVAYALLTRPGAFAVYAASSPSLWWDGFSILSRLRGFKDRLQVLTHMPRVLVTVGALEQDLPEEVPDQIAMTLADVQALVLHARMVDAAREFAEELLGLGVGEVDYVAFPDEDHGSVLPPAINRAMAFALKAWKPPAGPRP